MYDFMEKTENQNVGICGGYLVDQNFQPVSAGGHFPNVIDILLKFHLKSLFPKFYIRYGVGLKSDEIEKTNEIDHIIGADLFLRKSVIDIVGAFDEKYFMYLEETDLCYRIKESGYDVKFVNDARIMHLEGGSSNNKLEAKKRFKISQFVYLNKNIPEQLLYFKILYQILYFIDGYLLRNNESKILFNFVINLKKGDYS